MITTTYTFGTGHAIYKVSAKKPKHKKEKKMNYYESAENVTISRQRALRELEDHGAMSDLDQFDKDLGVKENYNAQEVLAWLGY